MDLLPTEDDVWRTGESCRLLTAMAALWHDVGKIGKAFQTKLVRGTPTSDAFRHEWLSLRLFQAFVGTDKEDRFWLERLADMDTNKAALSHMAKGWLANCQTKGCKGIVQSAASNSKVIPNDCGGGLFGGITFLRRRPNCVFLIIWRI